jgi:hypothetical protein
VVLQINKLRSVSVPKENELASLAPQLLKLRLTDGHSFYDGIVNDNTEGLTYDICLVFPFRFYFSICLLELNCNQKG